MVSCVVNSKDASHPGGGRAQKREHVLTNYKKETSGLLGGYLTIDARGFALQFTVARTPPAVDVATLGRASHYRLPWQQAAPFQCLDTDQLLVRLSSGAECSVSVADMLNASEQRLWLGATAPHANCAARKLTNADRPPHTRPTAHRVQTFSSFPGTLPARDALREACFPPRLVSTRV